VQKPYLRRYHSVSNLLHLQDNEGVEEPRRKSSGSDIVTQTTDIRNTIPTDTRGLVTPTSNVSDSKTCKNRQKHNRDIFSSCLHHRPHDRARRHIHNYHPTCCQH
jgi:galactitol-specific phosphotransferase system IIB component